MGSSERLELQGRFVSVLSSNGLILALQLLTGLVLARALGPEARGEYALILLWPNAIATLGHAGYLQAAAYFASIHRQAIDATYATLLFLGIVIGVVFSVVPALFLPAVFAGRPHLAPLLILVSCLNAANIIQALHVALLQGMQLTAAYNAQRVVVPATYAAVVIPLGVAGKLTLSSSITGFAGCQMAGLIVAVLLSRQAWARPSRLDRKMCTAVLSYAARGHFATIAAVANARLDQLLLSLFVGTSELGYYAVAATVASILNTVGTSMGAVLLPISAEATESGSRAIAIRALRSTVIVTALAIAAAEIILRPAILLVYGGEYTDSVNLCRILLIGALPLTVSAVLYDAFRSRALPGYPSIAEGVGLAITVPLLWIGLPRYGATAAAVVSLIGYSASAWIAVALWKSCRPRDFAQLSVAVGR